MSAPLCPACGYRPLEQVETAAEIKVAPEGSPLAYRVATYRTFRCCRCGTAYQSTEILEVLRGSLWIKHKMALDEAEGLPERGLREVEVQDG